MKTFTHPVVASVLAATALSCTAARATVLFSVSGTSAAMNPVSFQAALSITGDTLTIDLANTSPVDSFSAADVLSSFYFDISKAGVRPTLTFQSASGFVWQVKNNAIDLPYNYTPPALPGGAGTYTLATGTTPHVPSDLEAVKDNDRTWQFKPMTDTAAPYLGFGIGTVGNSGFPVNGFDVPIVGPAGPSQIAFSIFRDGNIQPVGNLADEFLVENEATFVFSGVSGYTEADIVRAATFGLGTGPDSTLYVPEPGGIAVAITGCLAALAFRHRRNRILQACCRSSAAGIVAALALVAWMVLAPVVLAVPVVIDNEYNFAEGPKGWTSQNVSYNNKPIPNAWAWSGGLWQVDPVPVISYLNWAGNYLTSPVIEVAQTIDILEFNIIHRYRFPQNLSTGAPVVAGQLVYRIYDALNPNAPFQPFALDRFETGPVPPPFDDKTPWPTWVAPTYVAPSNRTPLIPAGGTWTGESPGYTSGEFVASRATLLNLFAGQFVEFRLINANLGLECSGGGWDVSYVRVNGLAPEPNAATLAMVGGGAAAGGCLFRRLCRHRRHQRPSSPIDRPVRNTLPPVSVA